ncbi:MAG: sugar phosphate nucleotidyltransferase [Magnetococcus sp. WYHC-3]
MNYIVIMAGGSGTRLWPMSRKLKPKQLQNLVSERTLIQETYERSAKVVPEKNIFVSTTPAYLDEIKRQLPKVPGENYIVEPSSRNTFASLCFVLLKIKTVDAEAVIAAIPSDHLVQDKEAFARVFDATFKAAKNNPEKLITIGINPTKPETGLGYIKMGKQVEEIDGEKLFVIDKFEEKPNLATAQKYLQSWEYLWNTAYYFGTVKGILDWIKKMRPKTYRLTNQLGKLLKQVSANGNKAQIGEVYGKIAEEQVANVVAEDPATTLVIPADMDWSDIGDWGSLHDVLSDSFSSSIISRGHHVDYNSENCLIYAHEKMIATLGLKDIIVIDSPDVLLVANKHKTQDVKKILDRLKDEGKHLYL